MKKEQVKVGGTCTAKITDKVAPVRIDKEHPRGGWDATNLSTNRQVRIKSAQKLRGEVKAKDAGATPPPVRKELKTKAEWKGLASAGHGDQKKARPAEPRKKADGKMGVLDAAVKVLKEEGGERTVMGCKAIVEKVLAKSYWSTSGKTPEATLYSAIIREIRDKADTPGGSRFTKVGRGQFSLRKGA